MCPLNDAINIAYTVHKKVSKYLKPIPFYREVTGLSYKTWLEKEKNKCWELHVAGFYLGLIAHIE